jgi:hypothetical protein
MTNDLARSGSAPLGDLRARVLARTISTGEDRQQWLEARQGRVTATAAKELVKAGAAARRRLLAESFVPPVEITGNRYIDRGHEREPVIASWIRSRWPIEPNVALVASAENPRWACTPDGIGVLLDETTLEAELVLAEIKTSKHDLDPRLSYFAGTGYFEQMQWQMLVTGAQRTLFVWEQHDDDWLNGPNPIDLEPRFEWIDRDEAVIARMIAAADLFLAERDAAELDREFGGTGETATNIEVEALGIAILSAREEEKAAKARLEAPWTRLQTLLSKSDSFSQKTGLAQVTWNRKVTTRTVVDEEAALAADVKGIEGVTGRDLLIDVEDNRLSVEELRAKLLAEVEEKIAASDSAKALRASELVWESHRSEFTKEETVVGKPTLTVTAPKAAKA